MKIIWLSPQAKVALSFTTILSALTIPVLTQAATYEFDVNFAAEDQSIWDTGDAFNFTDTTFLGVDWNESGGIDPVTIIPGIPSFCIIPNPFGGCILRSPATPSVNSPGVNASTNGRIGFENTFNITGGEVDATIPVSLSFMTPDILNPGEIFTLESAFLFDNDATFSTIGPSISESLDLIFDVYASLAVDGLFNTGFDVNETLNLFALDSENPLPSLGNDFFSVTLGVPNVDTTGALTGTNTLSSSGESTFAEGEVNVTKIATSLLGLPPLNDRQTFDLGVGEVGFEYNLLTALGTIDLALVQDFALTGNLPGLLSINGADPISFTVGSPIELMAPLDATDFLDISATIDFEALFSNFTGLQFAPGFDISAFGATLVLPIVSDPSFGPLLQIDESFPINPPITLYNQEFALNGFNQQDVSFQINVFNPNTEDPDAKSVAEPGMVSGLAGIFLTGLLVKLRRRK